MNQKNQLPPVIFVGQFLKVLVSKLSQNPEYYPTKYLSKRKRKYHRDQNVF
jgi:hypothetical protein